MGRHRAGGCWFTPERRRRLYLVLVAGVPVVSLYGWLTQEEIAAWLGVAGAVLGLTTAAVNTVPQHVDNRDRTVTVDPVNEAPAEG